MAYVSPLSNSRLNGHLAKLMVAVLAVGTTGFTHAYTFVPNGCEYSVRFPQPPKIKIVNQKPALGKVEQAEYIYNMGKDSYYVRAECFPISTLFRGLPANRKNMGQLLRQYARNLRYRAPKFNYNTIPIGYYASVVSTQPIRGFTGRLQLDIYVGNYSVILVYSGANIVSRTYRPLVMAFHNSISRTK